MSNSGRKGKYRFPEKMPISGEKVENVSRGKYNESVYVIRGEMRLRTEFIRYIRYSFGACSDRSYAEEIRNG